MYGQHYLSFKSRDRLPAQPLMYSNASLTIYCTQKHNKVGSSSNVQAPIQHVFLVKLMLTISKG